MDLKKPMLLTQGYILRTSNSGDSLIDNNPWDLTCITNIIQSVWLDFTHSKVYSNI